MPVGHYRETPAGGDGLRRWTLCRNRTVYEAEAHAFRRWVLSHYRIYNNGTVRMGFYANDLDAPAAVKADKWAHICFWLDVDGKSRQIYIDGKSVVEDAGKAGIEYLGTAGDTIVGSWGNTGQRFNGIIDEVMVWDRALSEDDIKRSMEDLTAFPVDPADKVATTWASVKAQR